MTIVAANFKTLLESMFAETLGNKLVEDCTEAAVMYYSRYNPIITEANLALVEEQIVYDLPTDFLFMSWFDWWPDGEASAVGMTHNSLWDTAYEAAMLDAKATRLSPYHEVAGKKLVLHKEPETDETVGYGYYALHALDSGSYATIPSEDQTILLQLAMAEVLERKSGQVSLDPDITEGLLQLRTRSITGNIVVTLQILRAGVGRKYGGH